MKRKIRIKSVVILLAVLTILLHGDGLLARADSENNYICDSTHLGTVSANDTTGYTIGGFPVSSASPNFTLRYCTYANALGVSDTVTYNETSCVYMFKDSSDSNYTSYWSCRVNASEHSGSYGWYTTNIYIVNSDGSSSLHSSTQVYLSPITVAYSAPLVESTDVPVSFKYTDSAGGSIVSSCWVKGKQDYSYFEQGNASTSFSGSFVDLPSAGSYTVFLKDSNGYEKTQMITVSTANATLMLGVTQSDNSTATTTPVVNVLATKINNHDDERSVAGTDGDWFDMTTAAYSDSMAPYPSWSDYSYTFSQPIQHTFVYRDGGIDYSNVGDKYISGYFYKNLSGSFWADGPDFCNALWQGGYTTTTINCQHYIADSSWHFNYSELQIINPATNAYEDSAVRLGGNEANSSVAINGAYYTKVPAGSDESLGITRKWAYGTQPASYFDAGNGTVLTSNSFTVSQNGPVTVWAKTDDGQEAVRTYTVSNYDPYAGDTTPPTGSYNLSTSNWTTGSVTINVTATDAQSGVKSITLPSGTVVGSNTCSYTATSNGTYNFTLTDNAGNTCAYQVTVSNIDRSVSVSYTSSASYTIDPNNIGYPTSGGEITLINNNTHVGAQVTLQSLATALSGINGFTLCAQVEETASGNTTWSEIDDKGVQLAGGASTVLGVLSPGGTGHIKLVGQLGSLRWPTKQTDNGNMQLTFTAVS
ncbi:hypothetical protein [Ethanoligenens sp.]|uniref:hypothetical protein n=1 Tax=Ethanoligenens sp. TaxID=2099655 RepID=UPI0039ED4F51